MSGVLLWSRMVSVVRKGSAGVTPIGWLHLSEE
jgi:hypothetical protein